MTGAALRLPPQRERVRESSKSTTEPSNHSVVTFSCFHACLFAINFYKPLSRILTKLVLTVSVQFSMFLLEDESMEWPPPPYCSYHHFFFNVYLFLAVLSLRCCGGFSLVAPSGCYSLMGFSLRWLLLSWRTSSGTPAIQKLWPVGSIVSAPRPWSPGSVVVA